MTYDPSNIGDETPEYGTPATVDGDRPLRLIHTADPDSDPDIGPDEWADMVPDVYPDSDPDAADAETVSLVKAAPGAPVEADDDEDGTAGGDTADVPVTSGWAATAEGTAGRAPVIPAWLRDRGQREAAVRAIGGNIAYALAFHAVRSPKYAAKTAWYAPVGALRISGRILRWATAEEGNFQLRQHAANSNDAFSWQSLNRVRAKEAKGRWWVLIPAVLIVLAGVLALRASGRVPGIGWLAGIVALVVVSARAGRPADKPITDRSSTAARFTKLTADMVRDAFISLRFAQMKEPGSVQFEHPGIHRDGPGWLARVNLPIGLEAVAVVEKRGALSSALRLPVDQIWPAAGPDHAGQVDLWVGYQPASKMGQPGWSLAKADTRCSVFTEHEFATDAQQRPIKTALFQKSFLIGGQPGSGKSYAARALATIALLDPTCELKIAEFKGTGDFLDWADLCSTYVVGVDDEAFKAGAAILAWGLAEAERRGKRILAAKKRGLAPEGKVTPELAAKPGSGLHPVCIVIDEAHELFLANKESAAAAERLIKRIRALNMFLILATQIPDKNSLPPNLVRCINTRWCLSVVAQVENDMILGTGAYKRGLTGTVYRPGIDAGWGCMTGLASPVPARSFFPDAKAAAAIVARATALRHGQVVGAALEIAPARDLLADLHAVAAPNGQHWAVAAGDLMERWPEAYPAMTPEALSELARAIGLASDDVKIARKNKKGYKATTLAALIAARNTTPATSAAPLAVTDSDEDPDGDGETGYLETGFDHDE